MTDSKLSILASSGALKDEDKVVHTQKRGEILAIDFPKNWTEGPRPQREQPPPAPILTRRESRKGANSTIKRIVEISEGESVVRTPKAIREEGLA